MARIRTVKPTLWHDEAIGEVSLQARLTFIGLITQADDEGRQKGDARLIRSLVFPYDDFGTPEVSGWLAELSNVGLIERYSVAGKEFIELPSWSSHQRISHPTDSALPSHLEADSTVTPEDSGSLHGSSAWKGREEEGKGKDLGRDNPNPKNDLVKRVCSILAGGVDSLGENSFGRPWPSPRPDLIAKLVDNTWASVALEVAEEVRAIVQSQDRAPNVTSLYEQKLGEAKAMRENVREEIAESIGGAA